MDNKRQSRWWEIFADFMAEDMKSHQYKGIDPSTFALMVSDVIENRDPFDRLEDHPDFDRLVAFTMEVDSVSR